ncbi:uncharacterized protein F5147DRAFT_649153 [Suillus discolor]|uniref:DUF659 domain-containing protein n=1 Tax=Suillus discolor TaxID=1912936 RepID=A0A9P7FH10_9AGAM|nr:uncharacterized protein F5147DRAFT_649153 [Suillus discolor]KAG2116714.1 hypothetical protein F5147DRAFT_649153 [Suillus discolor]
MSLREGNGTRLLVEPTAPTILFGSGPTASVLPISSRSLIATATTLNVGHTETDSMAKTGKKSNRGWWWDHFVEHPGYATKESASMVSGKAKVICARLYEQRMANEHALDEQQIHTGQRDALRDEAAIAGTCVRAHNGSTTTPQIVLAAPAFNTSSVLESAHPSLPTLLIPETVASDSSSLLTRDSFSVSPALSVVSLPSQLGKCQHLNQSVKVHDASRDPQTAEELLRQILEAINRIESKWGATVIACTTDASGESRKARRLLREKFPHLVIPDCLAHQWNLIVGDLFKVKDDYGVYGDMAQELITWLRSKTHVLAILREIQMATIGKTLAVLRAVLTRWLSHYLAYCHLLELRTALELLVTKHEHNLIWKTLLEPISLMTNIHQAAQARPENIVISFGFLHFRYSKIENSADLTARTAVLASAERRWGQCDQEVFIAAVIVNPFYKVLLFQKIPLTTR